MKSFDAAVLSTPAAVRRAVQCKRGSEILSIFLGTRGAVLHYSAETVLCLKVSSQARRNWKTEAQQFEIKGNHNKSFQDKKKSVKPTNKR